MNKLPAFVIIAFSLHPAFGQSPIESFGQYNLRNFSCDIINAVYNELNKTSKEPFNRLRETQKAALAFKGERSRYAGNDFLPEAETAMRSAKS
jgi:hypothetical protein